MRQVVQVDAEGKPDLQHPYFALQVIAHEQSNSSWAEMCLGALNRSALILPVDHPFIAAVRNHDLAEVRRLLEADPQLANTRVRGAAWHLTGSVWEAGADGPHQVSDGDQRTATPLHHAAVRAGNADLARLLIEYGADVDALGFQDNCDISPPIRLAAWEGDLETMRVLLEAGADPDMGRGSLFSALEHDRRDKAELLLEFGARHDIFTASMYGDARKVRALVERQPELIHERSPSRNRLPIEEAVNVGQLEVARLLLDLGSETLPEVSAALGNTAETRQLLASHPDAVHAQYGTQTLLCWAARADQPEMVDFLIERGADPNQADNRGVTPLRKAVTARIVGHLVRGGAEPNLDSRGFTPFAAHVSSGNIAAAEALLRRGADPDQKCSHLGRTAYHCVLDKGTDVEDGLRFLLHHGADPSIPDDDGQTPLELALQHGRDEAARLLRQAMESRTV